MVLKSMARAWRSCNTDGLVSTWRRVGRRFWQRTRIIVYRKSIGGGDACGEYHDVRFRTVSAAEMASLGARLPQMGANAHTLLDQQLQPCDATIIGETAGNNPTVVFFLWVSRSQADLGMQLLASHRGPTDASLRRCWSHEAFRNKSIATRGNLFAEQVARQRGIGQLWSLVRIDNVPSTGLYRKLGYEPYGEIRLESRIFRRFARVKCAGDTRWSVTRIPADVRTL